MEKQGLKLFFEFSMLNGDWIDSLEMPFYRLQRACGCCWRWEVHGMPHWWKKSLKFCSKIESKLSFSALKLLLMLAVAICFSGMLQWIFCIGVSCQFQLSLNVIYKLFAKLSLILLYKSLNIYNFMPTYLGLVAK